MRYRAASNGSASTAADSEYDPKEQTFHHYATPRDKYLRCSEKEWELAKDDDDSDKRPEKCPRVPGIAMMQSPVEESIMALIRSTIEGT